MAPANIQTANNSYCDLKYAARERNTPLSTALKIDFFSTAKRRRKIEVMKNITENPSPKANPTGCNKKNRVTGKANGRSGRTSAQNSGTCNDRYRRTVRSMKVQHRTVNTKRTAKNGTCVPNTAKIPPSKMANPGGHK
ncbi:hypothetical protein D3C85_1084870 [compost metagenome]